MPFFRLEQEVINDSDIRSYSFNLESQEIFVKFKSSNEILRVKADLGGRDWLTVLETQLAVPAPQRHPRT